MAEDPKTRSLFLCVMDGHGEDGDKVTQNIKGKLANYLFNHRDFATNIKAAISDVIARCETEILRGKCYAPFYYIIIIITSTPKFIITSPLFFFSLKPNPTPNANFR